MLKLFSNEFSFHNELIVFSRWNHDYVLTFNYVEFKSQFLLYWFWYSMVIFDHQPKLFVSRSLSWSYCMHFLWRLHEKYITTTSTIVSRYLSGLWIVSYFLFQYLISGNFCRYGILENLALITSNMLYRMSDILKLAFEDRFANKRIKKLKSSRFAQIKTSVDIYSCLSTYRQANEAWRQLFPT